MKVAFLVIAEITLEEFEATRSKLEATENVVFTRYLTQSKPQYQSDKIHTDWRNVNNCYTCGGVSGILPDFKPDGTLDLEE